MKTKTTGCIKKTNNGEWEIDTKIKIGDVYKHLHKSGFKTLSDAKNQLDIIIQEFKDNNVNHYTDDTFEKLLDEYKKMREIKVNVTTLGCDKSIYNVYLLPYFKYSKLNKCLTKSFVSQWYENIVNSTKISQNKKSKVITRFKDILLFAYNHKYIDAPTYQDCDVCVYQINNYRNPRSERIVWTMTEEHKFNEATKQNKRDNIMFKLFIALGARISEFLALQVKCFDYNNRKIKIMQQLINTDKGVELTDKLKTHESYRSVIITQTTANELKEYIDYFNLKDEHYIFFGEKGRKHPMGKTTFRHKLYYYCDLAEIRRCNPHALRHRSAVQLASVCNTMQELETCAKRLGHSPEMFLNTYANHTNDEDQNALLERLYK